MNKIRHKYITQLGVSFIAGICAFIWGAHFQLSSQEKNKDIPVKKTIITSKKYYKKLIPMYSYRKDLKNAKPLMLASVDHKPIYIFFKPTRKYKKLNIKCCNEVDNMGEPVGAADLSLPNRSTISAFKYDLSKQEFEKRELFVDAQNFRGEYSSMSYLFYVNIDKNTIAKVD